MVEEAVELFIVVIVCSVIFLFFVGLCHMIYLAYCPRCCTQHSSENNSERTQAMFSVRGEDPETCECDQENRRYSIVFLTTNSIIN